MNADQPTSAAQALRDARLDHDNKQNQAKLAILKWQVAVRNNAPDASTLRSDFEAKRQDFETARNVVHAARRAANRATPY